MTMFHVLQTLLDRSLSIQDNGNPGDQSAEFQKLRHQHAQLLAFNHVLVEESNHRLVDHAELVSEVKFQTASFTTHASPEATSAFLASIFVSPVTCQYGIMINIKTFAAAKLYNVHRLVIKVLSLRVSCSLLMHYLCSTHAPLHGLSQHSKS